MSNKTASDIRQAFLDYFRGQNHEVVASASLIPSNDPTLMFNNAGMVQFKDVFTGRETRPYKRAASSQKCIRISGKHNDLENVGRTARHHTFFEMLGNFSFGDYFKQEAIEFGWEFLTKELGMNADRLAITVFGGEDGVPADDEARAIWRKVTGLGDDRILGMGKKDNFWQMGDTGPCGPCTEIHYYVGDDVDFGSFGQDPTNEGIGWMEIWNLVFMQFNRTEDGVLHPLPAPCVDTGAGLERIAAVMQGVKSNYDTDLLLALVDQAAEISGKKYGRTQADDDTSMRVIADHARTTAFMMAEGILPDRDGRAYVLRRVMRRAIRHGHRLGIERPFLHEVALKVVDLMGDCYPELVERREFIASFTEQEEVRFRKTLDNGIRMLDDEFVSLKQKGEKTLSGETAFKLYDTYGFPLDLTEVICEERMFGVDHEGYDKALAEAQARSKGSELGDKALPKAYFEALELVPNKAVKFVGYETEVHEGCDVVAIIVDKQLVDEAPAGSTAEIILDTTPFYGESGGQVGDTGRFVRGGETAAKVVETQKPIDGFFVHTAEVVGAPIRKGDKLTAEVDHEAREATRRNHSATHLLHYALRTVLGTHAAQKGSLVGPDRLRFDFTHGQGLSTEEVQRIEDLVNEKVLRNAPVETRILPIDEAKKLGAMAIFGDKYGDVVRVLTITPDSVELCGGTHARASGDIGLFKILSEAGIAAGVRRIEATTGLNALGYVRSLENTVQRAAELVKADATNLPDKVQKLAQHERQLEKEIADLKRKVAMGGGGVDSILQQVQDVNGMKVLSTRADVADGGALREMAEQLRDKLGEAVVVVGAATDKKAMLVATVSKGLTGKVKAGDIIRPVAKMVGGSGGGRPDMAQAGGSDPANLDEALASVVSIVQGLAAG
jgi:alanyl-tRNA synthetase